VDPVPDPLLFRKSGSAGNRKRDLWVSSQKLWLLDHRGGQRTAFRATYHVIHIWNTECTKIAASVAAHMDGVICRLWNLCENMAQTPSEALLQRFRNHKHIFTDNHSIYPRIFLPSIHPSGNPSARPSVHQSVNPSVRPSIYPPNRISILYLPIYLLIYPPTHLPTPPPTYQPA
jgi:hypothetical protein